MLEERDKVWIVPNPRGEEHPAIVVRVSDDKSHVLVISGTGTARPDIRHVCLKHPTRLAARLKLTKTTYFYKTAIHVRPIGEVRPEPPLKFPLDLWPDLQDIAEAGARERLSAEDFSEWWPTADDD